MKFLSLKYKLFLFSVILSFVLTLCFSLVEIQNDISGYKESLQHELRHLEKTYRPYLTSKVWALDYAAVKAVAVNEIGHEWVDRVLVTDLRGEKIAEEGRRLGKRSLKQRFHLTHIHNGRKIVIGTVFFGGNHPGFHEVLRERWASIFLLNGFMIAVIFLSSYILFHRNVVSRLLDIISFTRQKESGKEQTSTLYTPKKKYRPDEITLLIDAINERTRQIQKEFKKRTDIEADLKQKNRELLQEIQERRRIEKALHESREKYRLIIENQTDLVVKIDPQGRFEFVSPSYCLYFDKSEEALLGKPFIPQIHPDDRAEAELKMNLLNRPPYAAYFEHRVMAKDEWCWMAWVSNAIRNEKGEVTSIIGVGRDITEQKEFESALRTSQETFISVLDGINAMIHVTDIDTYDVLFMNRFMKETFGNDLAGRKCWEAFRNASGPCSFCTAKKLLDKNGMPTGVHIWNDRNPVTKRWYINHDRAIKWTDGRYVRLQIATDITDLRKMESELRQAHKMESIGILAGGIAHDFNNILGIIIGNAELAIDEIPEALSARNNIKEIQTASLRAKEVVRQLLHFSRKSEQAHKAIDIAPVIDESLTLIRPLLPSTIEIRNKIPENCGLILADATQIQQVIINLCTNAAHAMADQGGTLDISVETIPKGRQDNGYLELTITDTGSGIDPGIREKIFDPYFTTKDVGKGSGMGLAVVHGIVQNHNAELSVSSEPGRGSSFCVRFPITQEQADALPEKIVQVPSKGSETILFVDDEPSIADMAGQMLTRLGYTVETRTNPAEALEMIETDPNRFDLVISDMTMPVMNGVTLSEKIRQTRPDIPIIICTGHASLIHEEGMERLGVSAWAMKPFSAEKLSRTIRRVLNSADPDSPDIDSSSPESSPRQGRHTILSP